MIHLIKEKATSSQIQEMLERYEQMIKIVVDIRRQILSSGEMHAGCESAIFVRAWAIEVS